MTDVFDLLAQEARWLKVSRDELVSRIDNARRTTAWRLRDGQLQLKHAMADITHIVDRSIEPMFDAALAIAEVTFDLRARFRRIMRLSQ